MKTQLPPTNPNPQPNSTRSNQIKPDQTESRIKCATRAFHLTRLFGQPGRAKENSPPIHRWVRTGWRGKSRQGRKNSAVPDGTCPPSPPLPTDESVGYFRSPCRAGPKDCKVQTRAFAHSGPLLNAKPAGPGTPYHQPIIRLPQPPMNSPSHLQSSPQHSLHRKPTMVLPLPLGRGEGRQPIQRSAVQLPLPT